jgi:hypothetical protein
MKRVQFCSGLEHLAKQIGQRVQALNFILVEMSEVRRLEQNALDLDV